MRVHISRVLYYATGLFILRWLQFLCIRWAIGRSKFDKTQSSRGATWLFIFPWNKVKLQTHLNEWATSKGWVAAFKTINFLLMVRIFYEPVSVDEINQQMETLQKGIRER